jgi:hypothetical protein
MKAALILSLLAFAGCSNGPQLVQTTPTNVIVNHGNSPRGYTDGLGVAAAECQKYNRSAVMSTQTCPGARCISQFRCE